MLVVLVLWAAVTSRRWRLEQLWIDGVDNRVLMVLGFLSPKSECSAILLVGFRSQPVLAWSIKNWSGGLRPKPGSLVHVDDLVSVHIFLFEYPDAKGRYICSSTPLTLEEMSIFLSAEYPEFQIPTADSLKGVEGFKMCRYSSEKQLNSGFKFKHGLDDMYDGAVHSCIEKGFL
ncbi:putative dihydroflavanol 4-reductase [Rosa chinensis]|uniref:Putative dihydroflavanol 4-reductase n=1 Tax=Rosa chinensis TaxID=74649 RepID=A0A2P6SG10_ROSCH|nr:putative dihydroflavanol 4-reductase [Rosa chinensis]